MNCFKPGDIVVVESLDLTARHFGLTQDMRAIQVNRDEILVREVQGHRVRANGWSWHWRDLSYAKPFTLENE